MKIQLFFSLLHSSGFDGWSFDVFGSKIRYRMKKVERACDECRTMFLLSQSIIDVVRKKEKKEVISSIFAFFGISFQYQNGKLFMTHKRKREQQQQQIMHKHTNSY